MDDKVKLCIMLDLYGEFLTQRQRELADCYFNRDMSLAEIAENTGISRQGVHDGVKRAVKTLNDMEQKLSLAERELALRNRLETCIALAEQGMSEKLREELIQLRNILEES